MRRKKINGKWFGSWVYSLWPIFLIFSQKVLITLKFFEIFRYQSKIRCRGLIVSGGLLWIFLLFIFLNSTDNKFAINHLISFSLFLFFMVMFGIESTFSSMIRFNIKWITRINLIVLISIIGIYHLKIDLSNFRGLNFITGKDNSIHRFFIETSSLMVISNFRTRNKLFNLVLVSLTTYYFLALNKSLVLIALLVFQIIQQYNIYRRKITLFLFTIISVLIIFVAPSIIFRADLILSLTFKLNQILGIFHKINFSNLLLGEGLGFFLPEFATDFQQPYQIENQLPMLLIQIGLIGLILFISFVYNFFQTTIPEHKFKSLAIYLMIGLINPWLFLPTWLITSTYFFKKKNYV